jgi:hypothetical protein
LTVLVQVVGQREATRYADSDEYNYSYEITELGILRIVRGESDPKAETSKHIFKILIEMSPAGWHSVQGHRFLGVRPLSQTVEVKLEEFADPTVTIA